MTLCGGCSEDDVRGKEQRERVSMLCEGEAWAVWVSNQCHSSLTGVITHHHGGATALELEHGVRDHGVSMEAAA